MPPDTGRGRLDLEGRCQKSGNAFELFMKEGLSGTCSIYPGCDLNMQPGVSLRPGLHRTSQSTKARARAHLSQSQRLHHPRPQHNHVRTGLSLRVVRSNEGKVYRTPSKYMGLRKASKGTWHLEYQLSKVGLRSWCHSIQPWRIGPSRSSGATWSLWAL